MVIYTSYFAQIRKLPPSIVPISICIKPPAGYKGLQYKKLAPSYELLKHWKTNHNAQYYYIKFYADVIDNLNKIDVINDLEKMSDSKDVALICYEKPSDFCHRFLVAEWLSTDENLIKEYEFE